MQTPSRANQSFWDNDAAAYHAAHPDYLSSFYWCPEMLHEADAHLLGDAAFLAAALRNSWILLTLISLTGVPHVEAIVLGVLGISVLATGQTPFDMLANCLVERRPLPF